MSQSVACGCLDSPSQGVSMEFGVQDVCGSLTCKREKEEAYLGRGRLSCPQTWRNLHPLRVANPQCPMLTEVPGLPIASLHQWTKAHPGKYKLRQESFSSRGRSELLARGCLLTTLPTAGQKGPFREGLSSIMGVSLLLALILFCCTPMSSSSSLSGKKIQRVCLRSCG